MKIALIIPDYLSGTSFLQQPLDILYTSSVLEKSGYDVSVFDCRTDHISISHLLKQLVPFDVILITTTPSDQIQNYFLDYRYAYTAKTVNSIKLAFPGKFVAVCGAHGTIRHDLIFSDMNVDAIIKGEPIYTTTLLVNALSNNKSIECVPNIVYRKDDTYIETQYEHKYFHPVLQDDLFPDYKKIKMNAYYGVHYKNNIPLYTQNRAVIQGGRGCPFSCSFCYNFFGCKVRHRSVDSVIEEINICVNNYGVKEFFFLDEVFTLDTKWVADLCEKILKHDIKVEFTVQTRVDCLNIDILKLMKKAGFSRIWLGVESADDYILNINNKGIHIDEVTAAISVLRTLDIEPLAYFMLGMPGETVNTINKTIKQIYDYKIPYTKSLMICTPRYGTEYYKIALKQYPEIENHWYNLNSVKGLVNNEMTPSLLQKAKSIFKQRDFIFEEICPQL